MACDNGWAPAFAGVTGKKNVVAKERHARVHGDEEAQGAPRLT